MKIDIIGQEWTVELVAPHDPEMKVNGNCCAGVCWKNKYKICLSNEFMTPHAKNTIRHELTHAFIFSTQAAVPEAWDEEEMSEFIGIYGKQISDLCEVIYNELYKGE
jgi:hypothetical protein